MLEDKDKHRAILIFLGKRIKLIRVKKGFRQTEIAYRCNFDKSSYNNIEAGKRNVTILTLCKIAYALEEPISSFITSMDEELPNI